MAAAPAGGTTARAGRPTRLGPWGSFLVRRLAGLTAVAVTLVAGTFLMVQLIPGDPARVAAGADAMPADVERARHDLGLDQPLLTRFGIYTGGLLRGDVGASFQTKEPVADIIGGRLPFTAEIALLSVLVVLVLAVPIGLAAAARGSRRTDASFTFVTGTVGATPEYIIGTLLVLGFAIKLGWFPAAGAETVSSMVLPVAALALPATCVMARIVRSEATHVLTQDYMRTARGRRLPPLRLYARHALPNLLTATLTLGGLILAGLLGGTVVVESVFAWPGIGQRVVEALLVRDYPVIQGCVLVLGLLAALLNLLVDIVLALLDPRTLAGKEATDATHTVERTLVLALTGLGLIILLGVAAPLLLEEEATVLSGAARAHVSAEHWLGTDALGRDVLARTLVATRLTLMMTLAATAIAAVTGILLGTGVWVSGRRVRELGLRLIDVMISYPALILALVIATVLGTGPTASVLAIGLGGAPAFARLTANMAASVAQRDFVAQARLMGVPPYRVLVRHLLPNISGPLLVLLSVAFANVLVALSGLSFLGVGVQAPDYDWGGLLNSGLESLYTNPAEAIGPAVAITITGVLAGFVGDGLAAALDPRGGRAKAAAAPPTATPTPSHRAPGNALVTADGLAVVLPDGTRLVDDVSFHVMPGEIVGLVGESGSGKSLTAMSVARLLPEGLSAHAAELSLDDLDLAAPEADPRRLATEIGIVFQDPSSSFNPALRMGGQLTETLRVHQGVRGAEADRRAVEALEQVRIKEPARVMKQYPHELSGGMRQRAMIAAALLPGPRLIVADEPTTALDVTVQAEVLDLLKDINRLRGTSVLLISHDIDVVGTVCHRVMVMYAGRVVEELSAADLRAGHVRHPYTRALLAASPRLRDTGTGERAPLATIRGRPPTPAARPTGCAFADRCPVVLDTVCATERPRPAGGVACHAAFKEVQAE